MSNRSDIDPDTIRYFLRLLHQAYPGMITTNEILDIMNHAGFNVDESKIRRATHQVRTNSKKWLPDYFLLSNPEGLFLSKDPAKAQLTVMKLRKRAYKILKAASALEQQSFQPLDNEIPFPAV